MAFFLVDGPVSLIEVKWDEVNHAWSVYARRSRDDDWEEFTGAEAELDTLMSLARDVVTGG